MVPYTFDGFLAMMGGQAPEGMRSNPKGDSLKMLGMIFIMFVVMYVILIRPQQKKAREHADLVKTLKPGDKVLTSGGVLGVVVSVKEKSVSIRSADTKLEIVKSSVTEIVERSGGESKSS